MLFKTLHIIIIIIGILFIFLSTFHSNLWLDESYSVGMANQTLVDIWKIGGHDVHPVLYYWMLRIVNILTKGSILAYRLFSVIPIVLLGLLGFTHIKKDFGEKAGVIFSFLCYFVPIMVVYANQIRMYSWAIYIVSSLAIYAYRIYLGQSIKKNWMIFGLASLASIFIHYYGLMVAGLINLFLLIYFIKNKKWKELKWQILLGIIQAVLYLPWIIYLVSQMKHVSEGFWIEYEPAQFFSIIGCQMIGNMNIYIGFTANTILFIVLGIIIFTKRKNRNINWKPVIYSIIIYLSVIIVALIINIFLKTSILHYRYLFVITGLYLFTISYILSKVDNKYIVITICAFILILGIINNIIQIRDNYDENNSKPLEYVKTNIQEGDIIVYKNIGVGALYASSFLENKQFFYNPEDWKVLEAYKAWSPQMETYITKNFLENCIGRVWIIDSESTILYNELFNNLEFKYISKEYFETKYKGYVYNITLVERIEK